MVIKDEWYLLLMFLNLFEVGDSKHFFFFLIFILRLQL